MRNHVAVFVASLLLAAPVAAQEAAPTTRALLADVAPADLVGESWHGLYLNGKSIGTLAVSLTLEGDELRGRLASTFTLAGVTLSLTEVGTFGPGWTPRRLKQTTQEGDDPPEEVTVERKGDLLQVVMGERTWSHAPGEAHVVIGQLGRVVLARALLRARAPAGQYGADELTLEDERATALDVRVAPDPVRPGARRVSLVPRDDPGGAWEALVGPDGALESLSRSAEPGLVYLRAKDEAAARLDRPDAGVPPGSPRAVVLEYLRGLVLADAARVEGAIDWPALHQALGAADTGQDVDAFKRAFLEGLERARAELDLGPDDVEALAPAMVEELAKDGATAWVTIPGEDHRVRLGRTGPDGAWRIHTMID